MLPNPKRSLFRRARPSLWWTLSGLLLLLVAHLVIKATTPIEQKPELPVAFYPEVLGPWKGFRIAVLSDVHLIDAGQDLERFRMLLGQVVAEKPSLVLLLGDYINASTAAEKHQGIREGFAKALELLDGLPVALVLGNHESRSGYNDWVMALSGGKPWLLENKTTPYDTAQGRVCVRGIGDSFSGHKAAVAFSPTCGALPRLTITHDPAGGLGQGVDGLVLAGHTHCGQISLPLIGPLWIPTKAPREASCGVWKDQGLVLFVSSGIGTSILPLRFGAQAGWDLLEIN